MKSPFVINKHCKYLENKNVPFTLIFYTATSQILLLKVKAQRISSCHATIFFLTHKISSLVIFFFFTAALTI